MKLRISGLGAVLLLAVATAGCGAKTPLAASTAPAPPKSGPEADAPLPSLLSPDAFSPSPSPTHRKTKPPANPSVSCPSTPLRGVYHSYRLHVLKTCQWFAGTVIVVRHEADGDLHFNAKPDQGYAKFLTKDNYRYEDGGLVVEIMPGQKLPGPSVGEHVKVFGSWVYDSDHGWNEIHPVWAIQYGYAGKTVSALPPSTPEYNPDESSGGSGGGGSSAGNCDPNYVVSGGPCLQDGIGDYDCYGGSGDGPNYTPPGATIKVVGTDVFGLDRDHDGYGCD